MPCGFKELLEKIAAEKVSGPPPTFSVLHMVLAMELIAERNIGRNKLADNLSVGEGAIRTIIRRLKDSGLIEISKSGCALTEKGSGFWKKYTAVFKKKVEFGKSELALSDHNFIILVRKHGLKIRSGMDQRDAAIMVGAKSATTIIFKNGRLAIPSVSNDVAKDFPKTAAKIIELLEPHENDAIVIGSGDTSEKAQYGTLAAAWTLIDDC